MDFDHTFIVDKTRDFHKKLSLKAWHFGKDLNSSTEFGQWTNCDSRTFVINHSSNLLSRTATNRYICQRRNEQAVNREETRC